MVWKGACVHGAGRDAEDAGVRDGLASTHFVDFPATRRLEVEQAAQAEAERELGKRRNLLRLREKAREASARRAHAERRLHDLGERPGRLVRWLRLWFASWLRHCQRRELVRRARLTAADEHARELSARVSALVELGLTQVGLAYARGCLKGNRLLSLSTEESLAPGPRSRHDTLPDDPPWELTN
jgi:hypothetical protein